MRRIETTLLVLLGSVTLAGCELVEGIFRLGFWAGIILAVVLVVVIWLIIRLIR